MGGGYGQNIAAGVSGDNVTAVITNLFYNGEVNWYSGLYGQAQPSMANFEHWGHFSQIVWKATTHVGCHTQDCSGQGLANTGGDVSPYFTVCNYKSAGMFHSQDTDLCPISNVHQATSPTNTARTSVSPSATRPSTGTTACKYTAIHEILFRPVFPLGHSFLLSPEAS